MAISEPETAIVSFSGAGVHLRYTGDLGRLGGGQSPTTARAADRPAGIARFVGDSMLRSSLFLILNTGIQAGFGAVFWIMTARLFSTESVGKASTLISAASLISVLGLLGLNTTFLRFLPTSGQRNRLITTGLILVGAASAGLALVYVLFIPLFARPISSIAHSLPLAVGFVVLTAGVGVNGITDSVFIAAGKSGYNAITDGLIGGIGKIIMLVTLVGAGSYGIFVAATGGYMAAAVASLLLMAIALRWRPQLGNFGQVLKPVLRFSGANYAGSILMLLPNLVVPLIVLTRMGPTSAAYYYVAGQLMTLIYAAVSAVEQSFLVEGSQGDPISRAILLRSIRILSALCIPAIIATMLFGHYLLLAFGPNYGRHAVTTLIPLTISILPLAANNWFMTVLRMSNRLKPILWSNIVFSAAITGLAWVLSPGGLSMLATAWPIGSTAAAVVSGAAAMRTIRRQPPLREHSASSAMPSR